MSSGRRASAAFVGDKHFVPTPSDTVNFTDPDDATKPIDAAIAVLSVGNVAVVDTAGRAVTWVIAAAPFVIPVRARRVNVTNTTGGITLVAVY
jgi:hypothetical protein